MTIRRYQEMRRISTLEGRFDYLALRGKVGGSTFGFERYVNQAFYRSREWRQLRDQVIVRDNGCDLGIEGYEIHDRIVIHHMNPMTAEQVHHGDEVILDINYLITTTHLTHNAIHYGDRRLLPQPHIPRSAGDTQLWGTRKEQHGAITERLAR